MRGSTPTGQHWESRDPHPLPSGGLPVPMQKTPKSQGQPCPRILDTNPQCPHLSGERTARFLSILPASGLPEVFPASGPTVRILRMTTIVSNPLQPPFAKLTRPGRGRGGHSTISRKCFCPAISSHSSPPPQNPGQVFTKRQGPGSLHDQFLWPGHSAILARGPCPRGWPVAPR